MTNPSQKELTLPADDSFIAPKMEPWKIKTLAMGGVMGAGIGLLAAFLLVKNSERQGVQPSIGAREGFQIAILAFGLIRSVANIWED